MKYIKLFEHKNTRLDELTKLLSHIANMFAEFGYINKPYYTNDKYANNFYNEKGRSFDINGEFSSSLIVFDVIMRVASANDDLVDYIPEYFKTIDGLKLYRERPEWFTTVFEVVDNVDNIIPQITKEDFESKMNGNKYNL